MKQLYLLVFLGLAAICAAQSSPEDEIPIFNLDDYYVPQKFTLSVGARALTGAQSHFGGQGLIQSNLNNGDLTSEGIVRYYHDGIINLDSRLDGDGNPLPSDGRTSNWGFYDAKQLVNNDQDIAFHTYSAQVDNMGDHSKDPGMSLGTELLLTRDMGHIGKRLQWKFFAGFSMNGISSRLSQEVPAIITTVTDTYSLNGQTPPTTIPYSAPSSTTDADGNLVDTTILIGQKPDSRTETTSTGTAVNAWKLKGTYLTLRMGPTLLYSITDNFRVSLSAGPALTYAGTTYSVEQTLTPDIGATLNSTVTDTDSANLFGYYVDTTLEYLINDRAGLYMGAFYQTSGDYEQDITQYGSSYTTTVDLSKLQGFRAGLNFKF
jgi:hypothetical protein